MIKTFISYTLLCLVVFSFVVFQYNMLSATDFKIFLSEDGPLEKASALFFALSAIIAAYGFIEKKTPLRFSFTLLMIMASMREMDLHKEWTTDSILKSRFYLSEATPVLEKVIGLLVIAILVACVVILLKNALRWLRSLYQQDIMAWTIVLSLGSIIAGKLLDSMARLFPFTAEYKHDNPIIFLAMEESFEFIGAFCCMAVAALTWAVIHRRISP